MRIDIPDELVEHLDESLVPGWELANSPTARRWGDTWLTERRTPAASVPSLPARPVGRTIAINPLHPAVERVRVGVPFPVPWDERPF